MTFMTKEQLWKIYTDKNPSFLGDKPVTMSPQGLKKMFDQTFDLGEEHGKNLASKRDDLIEKVFGRKF